MNTMQLFELMREGACLITPNNRLAKELTLGFFKLNQKPVQERPSCLPYSAFLQTQFEKLCLSSPKEAHPFLMKPEQLSYLWRQIVTKSKVTINEGLLQALMDAWTRCLSWQLDLNHSAFETTEQTRQFQRWALSLSEELKRNNCIIIEQIADYLINQDHSSDPKTLIWACFDEYTPQQLALQQYLNQQGFTICHYDLENRSNSPLLFTAKDEEEEYQQLLLWLQNELNLGKRVAVVIPDLSQKAAQIKRFLDQADLADSVNISLGLPLSHYPLIAHALCWLTLDARTLSSEQARLLLQSPYLDSAEKEFFERAELLEESILLQEQSFSLSSFVKEMNKSAPKLANCLANIQTYPAKASLNDWIDAFKTRLNRLGFPGENPLNSSNYQCFQRFLALFDEFQSLHLLSEEMTQTQALSTFRDLAKAIIFQPKTQELSIQVLGLLEASGLSFDSLWICGLTDELFPKKTKLSAFIPIALQQSYRMPYSSPEKELELAQKILNRFNNSASQVVYSYALLSGDKPNLPSPLIAEHSSFSPLESKKSPQNALLLQSDENYRIPLYKEEKIKGGSALLANQAKCPFRAFAEHRLQAKPTLSTSRGPDAKERGQMIHKVMEFLWQKLQTQERLLTLNAEVLDQFIKDAIEQTLAPLITKRSHSFSTLFQEVERARLMRLVRACLEWERQRPSFVVEALEQDFQVTLAGIDFRLRVDRLDRVEDKSKWVIDYKSSFPSSLPWKEERPKEPQLLLYALLDELINSLLFVELKEGKFQSKGLSAENYSLPGLATLKKGETWEEYRSHWQKELTQLAEEFSQGQCQPEPASASICQLCHFDNLCRIEN